MLSHVLVVVLGHSERRVWDRGSVGSVIGVEITMPVDRHGPTQTWNSPLHQVYEILQEATAETRILPLVGQQEAGGCLKGGGGCWSRNSFAHFSTHSFHCIFIMISMKKYGEKIIFFPAARFRGNGGHIRFKGTLQGTYNFKTATSNAVKSCTHIEDI